MKKVNTIYRPNRRQVIKAGLIAGVGMMGPWRFLPSKVFADPVMRSQACDLLGGEMEGCFNFSLADPSMQPKFESLVPDAMAPSFKFQSPNGKFAIEMRENVQMTGLVGADGVPVPTTIWGYGTNGMDATWPGRTFEVQSGTPVEVKWKNKLPNYHLLPVDTNLHWAYSLHGYTDYSIAKNGVPAVTHLHGGHTDFQYDGNPEFFFSPGYKVRGPQWRDKKYIYANDQPAGNLWYHDHALGITRLNVYAGLAGFYFIRDDQDTGKPDNPLGLPAWPYEKAYAIQDRMFKANGELFYPAFPGDPYYEGFINDEGAILPPDLFPGGGPTGLAEFFGDHMVVNGVIWPYESVDPRTYRLHLLNGTDSRFMAIQLWEVPAGAEDFFTTIKQIDFTVIGSDQGLAYIVDTENEVNTVDTLLIEPGSRYDIIVDFSKVVPGNRVIMKNIGGDEPFGGDLVTDESDLQIYQFTDRIMAFDVADDINPIPGSAITILSESTIGTKIRTRKVALFEGLDEFGRLQPLLGTAEKARDYTNGADAYINWPTTPVYQDAKLPDGTPSTLTGPIEGSVAWHSPTTENPELGTTEEWEIWNMTGDAHPIHLHLVHFEVLGRQEIVFDSHTDEDGFIDSDAGPANDGVYRVPQPTVQHNSVAGVASTYGMGFKIVHPDNHDLAYGPDVDTPPGVVENTPKDMVTALPGQITRIKMTFDKPGRYVWHCHILSHEDHEMMRVLHVTDPSDLSTVA